MNKHSEKNIVFILGSKSEQRYIKRIEEFIKHGYSVHVYGFDRNLDMPFISDLFTIETVGTFSNNLAYTRRISILLKGIKKVHNEWRDYTDIAFYYFSLDIACLSLLLKTKQKFLYEESDLRHTYIRNKLVSNIFEKLDLYVIKRSVLSVFTSEGFIEFHYGAQPPANTVVISNKVNQRVLSLDNITHKPFDERHVVFGFVGVPRFESVMIFAKVIGENYPQHEFHFFGKPMDANFDIDSLEEYGNIYFHGSFSNPKDLPSIYSSIDFVVSLYDADLVNVRYAEPNKLYESIYFRVPIIVSDKTFLASKVASLQSGIVLKSNSKSELVKFINSITNRGYKHLLSNLYRIPKMTAVNINTDFFKRLESLSLFDNANN